MRKKTFNDSEMFLLKNWPSARRMEEAMNAVRFEKYAAIIGDACRLLVDRLGKSDWEMEVFPTQHWCDGWMTFWPKKWEKCNTKGETPWFRIGGLRLEHLLSDDAPSMDNRVPYAAFSIRDLRKAGWDLVRLMGQVQGATKQMLRKVHRSSLEDEEEPVCYNLPEGRTEIRRLLLSDEAGFTRLLIAHGLRLADLAPTVSKVLANYK